MTPQLAAHTTGVVAALEAAGLVVGDGYRPTVDHGWRKPGVFISYCIVYPLANNFDGTLDDTYDDLDAGFQVTCVGGTRAGVQAVEDTVNDALLDGTVTVTGRTVMQVRPDGGGLLRRDETVTPYVYLSTPRYRLISTPS